MQKLISINNIILDLEILDKINILKYISDLSFDMQISKSSDSVNKELINRENDFSTNLSQGIALPHIKSNQILKPSIIIIKPKYNVYWDSSCVSLIISILIPLDFQNDQYLNLISNLSRKLANVKFIDELINKNDRGQILKLIENAIYKEE